MPAVLEETKGVAKGDALYAVWGHTTGPGDAFRVMVNHGAKPTSRAVAIARENGFDANPMAGDGTFAVEFRPLTEEWLESWRAEGRGVVGWRRIEE